jgi:fructose-bisphosphate aldolase class 1
MNRTEIARIANAMVAKNKGILAADESRTGRYCADQETQAA